MYSKCTYIDALISIIRITIIFLNWRNRNNSLLLRSFLGQSFACYVCVFNKFYVTLYTPFTDDLSHNKDASQSHTFTGPGYGAENAVDGNTATCMRTSQIGPNSPYKTVWWKVDLGGVYNIFSVNILFKNYNGYGMNHKMHKSDISHKSDILHTVW